MPCILVKTNQTISKVEQLACCQTISAKLASLLNKPESYVMALLEPNLCMTFAGTSDAAAYIELKSINLPEDKTSHLSRDLCQLISEQLNIPQNRIYIEFSNAQRHLWGWDGQTF
jgi:phenylpyruvate tautomerase PptA (4-oxalocrotonate tautomerase family)